MVKGRFSNVRMEIITNILSSSRFNSISALTFEELSRIAVAADIAKVGSILSKVFQWRVVCRVQCVECSVSCVFVDMESRC